MSEKEQQFERIYKETENFGRTQFVREIQMQINDNKKKDKEIERLNKELQNLEKLNNANYQSFIEVNNIINELGKWLEDMSNRTTLHISTITGFTMCLNKLQELKEGEKSEKN